MQLMSRILAVEDEECQKSYAEIRPHYTPQANLHSITLTKPDTLNLTLYNKPHNPLPHWQRVSIELMDEQHIDHKLLAERLKLQFLEKRLEATGSGEVSILYVYHWLLNRKIKVMLKTNYLHTSETDLWGIYQLQIQKEQV